MGWHAELTQQQNDKMAVSASRITYQATASGVHIVLLGTVTGSNYQAFNWVQTVTTTDPLHGNPANTPYADTDPGQKTPFYWNPTEQTQFEAMGKAKGDQRYSRTLPRGLSPAHPSLGTQIYPS